MSAVPDLIVRRCLNAIRAVRAVIVPLAQSRQGILLTVIVAAWVTYRCYQAKQG